MCGNADVPNSSEKSGILIETSNPSPSCTQIKSFHWESYGFASGNEIRFISIFEGCAEGMGVVQNMLWVLWIQQAGTALSS